jgi:2,4-dienoyl-CoA reductase-like NADH-dependent reductase (Old Yellow Enzyme family)
MVIHGAHGYLFGQFISPLQRAPTRTAALFVQRMRFPLDGGARVRQGVSRGGARLLPE